MKCVNCSLMVHRFFTKFAKISPGRSWTSLTCPFPQTPLFSSPKKSNFKSLYYTIANSFNLLNHPQLICTSPPSALSLPLPQLQLSTSLTQSTFHHFPSQTAYESSSEMPRLFDRVIAVLNSSYFFTKPMLTNLCAGVTPFSRLHYSRPRI